jgi:hypothetical protein
MVNGSGHPRPSGNGWVEGSDIHADMNILARGSALERENPKQKQEFFVRKIPKQRCPAFLLRQGCRGVSRQGDGGAENAKGVFL